MIYEIHCINCTRYGSYGPVCGKCVNHSEFTLSPNVILKEKGLIDPMSICESVLPEGQKFDSDKLDWTLLPWKEVEQVLEILEFGAKKYSKDNWQKVESSRYEKAAMRHLISYVTGEKNDQETGKSHLAHLVCNALFLMWNDNNSLKS